MRKQDTRGCRQSGHQESFPLLSHKIGDGDDGAKKRELPQQLLAEGKFYFVLPDEEEKDSPS